MKILPLIFCLLIALPAVAVQKTIISDVVDTRGVTCTFQVDPDPLVGAPSAPITVPVSGPSVLQPLAGGHCELLTDRPPGNWQATVKLNSLNETSPSSNTARWTIPVVPVPLPAPPNLRILPN